MATRAAGYDMPGVIVDGVERARVLRRGEGRGRSGAGGRRTDAHRGEGHPAHGPLVRRPADEVSIRRRSSRDLAAKDPLPRFRAQLRDAGVLTEELEASIAAELKAEVDEATDYSEAAAEPSPETAMKWVYAEDWPGETPPPWGFTLRGSSGH